MKKILFCLALFASCFASCSKSDKKSTETPAMDFTINGVSDVTYKFEKITMPITLTLVSGSQENVSLSITGLPAGMKGVFAATNGVPTFSTTLEFSNSDPVTYGTYPLQVSATSASGKVKTLGMNLIVTEGACDKLLEGDYTGESSKLDI